VQQARPETCGAGASAIRQKLGRHRTQQVDGWRGKAQAICDQILAMAPASSCKTDNEVGGACGKPLVQGTMASQGPCRGPALTLSLSQFEDSRPDNRCP
jgi:hypothetical protein